MILWRCFVTANEQPLIYADACIFLEVLQQTHGRWRDSLKVLLAAERGDVQLLASRLLAVEVGRFRGDASRSRVDELVLKYLESVNTQWAEVDLLISRQARELSWQFGIKSGADAIHLATAVRLRADYFMSRDGGFPYGQTIESTFVTNPQVVWTPSLFDAQVDSEPEPVPNQDSSSSRTGSLTPESEGK
jgi:predicted nucleic acid-binding protein